MSKIGGIISKLLRRLGIILVILLLIAYLGYQFYERKRSAEELAKETLENAIETVSVIHAKLRPPYETITLPGNIQAWYQAPIYGRIPGYVKMWYTDYGAEVKEGDLLAILNTPILDAEFRMAEAEVKAREAQYHLAVVTKNRYVGLGQTKAVSVQSVTVQKANEKVKKAELNRAIQELENIKSRRHFKHILAPYEGIVIARNVNVGDYVNERGSLSMKGDVASGGGGGSDKSLFTVADVHKMRLFVSVPERVGQFLAPGLTAEASVLHYPDRIFKANFLTVAKGFDPNTRTAIAEFMINNDDRALWPGSYAKVNLTVPVKYRMLVLPTSALVFQEKGTQVAVVTEDGHAHFKDIIVDEILNSTILVKSGISTTDRIIDNPSAALLEGDEVRTVTPRPGYIRSTEEESESGAQPQETTNNSRTPESDDAQPQDAASKKSASNDTLPYQVGPYRFDVALEPKKPVVGENTVIIYLRNEQGQPIQDANIEAIAKMPAIDDSMPAMQVPAKIREVRPGIYGGLLKLPMEGSWPLTLRFKTAGAPEQEVVLDIATGRNGLAVRNNPDVS